MSIDRCSKCSNLIDTDDEPESYVEIGNMRAQTETVCLCRGCRERYEDEQERHQSEPREMPRDWQPTPEQIEELVASLKTVTDTLAYLKGDDWDTIKNARAILAKATMTTSTSNPSLVLGVR